MVGHRKSEWDRRSCGHLPNDAKTVFNAFIAYNLGVDFDNCLTGTLPFSTNGPSHIAARVVQILSSNALSPDSLPSAFFKAYYQSDAWLTGPIA